MTLHFFARPLFPPGSRILRLRLKAGSLREGRSAPESRVHKGGFSKGGFSNLCDIMI